MAPAGQQPLRIDREKRLNSVISFAIELRSQLPSACNHPPGSLFKQLEDQFASVPSFKSLGSSAASRCEEVDNHGTKLWNLCTQLRRKHQEELQPVVLLLARVWAFFLLDLAGQGAAKEGINIVRLMKIGNKAVKLCLEGSSLDYALRVLEKLAGYEVLLQKLKENAMSEDIEVYQRLIAEYYVLRTSHAWKQNQPEVAEHMFKKSMAAKPYFDPSTAESLADVLYEIGKGFQTKQQYDMAAKWLERANDVLGEQELDRLSMDASELRMAVMESWIKTLLGMNKTDATEKARDMLDQLQNEFGDKLIVLLLRLELLSLASDEVFDSLSYKDILGRMTRSIQLTDSNFKLMMFHVRKLKDKSPSLACKALDDFIQLRILLADKDAWLEKVLITRIWMTMGQKDTLESSQALEAMFDLVITNLTKPLEAAAIQSAHVLLWKRIESSYTLAQYDETEKWCRVALHKLFEHSGEFNLAKILRKLLLCALARQDFNAAREIFLSMPDSTKNEPMTRFLMYKIALRCEEYDVAADCLHIISSTKSTDPTLLYACVLDAQHLGDKRQTLAALQLVLEKSNYGAPTTVNLPSLLRVTIQLSVFVLNEALEKENAGEVDRTVERLCKLFEGGTANLGNAPLLATEMLWKTAELDWFSKNSYNLAITHVSSWHPRSLLRMFKCCIAYIDHYPADISRQVLEDLSLRKLFCEFSAATALVALARGEDNIESQLQDYLMLRKHVVNYDTILEGRLNKMEERDKGKPIAQDLLHKLAVLLGYDFEAVCHLKSWDELGEVVMKTEVCKNARIYEVMADCMLACHAPTPVVVTNLKRIINCLSELPLFSPLKLAKYLRCLFQLSLSSSLTIAEDLLDQILALAEEIAQSDYPYPQEELEWIATRAYNHAIDLYVHDRDEDCQNWVGKALGVARIIADEGALEKELQEKYAGLRLGEK